jgi:AcrR family transcriptional regulator
MPVPNAMTTKAPNVPRTTAKPQDTQRNDVREALLSAAMKLAAESRDLSFSLRQLAEAADTSTMSIYTQFGNREGLNRALSARAFGLFADELKRATADIDRKDVVPLLQRMAQAYRKFAQDHPSGFDLLFGDINSFDTVPPLSNQYEGLPSPSENGYVVYGLYYSAFETGVAQGVFRNDAPVRLVMDSFWAQLHGLVALERLGYVRSPQEAEDRFAYGIEAILRGLK